MRLNILATPTQIANDSDFKAWARTVKPALDHVNMLANAGLRETYPGGEDGRLTTTEVQQYHYWTRLGLYNYTQAITYFHNSKYYGDRIYYRYSSYCNFSQAYFIVTSGSPYPAPDILNPWQQCQDKAVLNFAKNVYGCGGALLVPGIGEILGGGCMLFSLGIYMNAMQECAPKRR